MYSGSGEASGLYEASEENEVEDAQEINEWRERVVYLVDAGHTMFQQQGVEGSAVTYFGAVMESIEEDLKSRIIANYADKTAVVFFNTREKKNIHHGEGVYVLEEMAAPSAQIIRNVATIKGRFEAEIGSRDVLAKSHESPLHNALWVAQVSLNSKISRKTTVKRIMLFTNEDDPFGGTSDAGRADLQRVTTQRAKDTRDMGIELELLPMNPPGEEFNFRIFYSEAIKIPPGEDLVTYMGTAASRLEDLKRAVRKRSYKKRIVRHVSFQITDGVQLALRSYAMIRPSKINKDVSVEATQNIPLKAEVSLICQDTGAVLSGLVRRSHNFGSQKAIFLPEEIAEVKKVAEQDLVLLGFKPLGCLKDHHNLQPATFLYPDEERCKGSTAAFIALHTAMARKERFAVGCWGKSLQPRLVAIVAQEEREDESGQVEAPGFEMIFLPFFDDIRAAEQYQKWDEAPAPRASELQTEKAAAMLRKLDLKDFSVLDIRNPALQRHYAILQAIALDEAVLPSEDDDTLPDVQGMQRPGVVKAVKDFKDEVYGPTYDDDVAAELAKRNAGAEKRRQLADAASARAAQEDWSQLADDGKLEGKTNEELKLFLRARGLPLTGKKKDLVDRILNALNK